MGDKGGRRKWEGKSLRCGATNTTVKLRPYSFSLSVSKCKKEVKERNREPSISVCLRV